MAPRNAQGLLIAPYDSNFDSSQSVPIITNVPPEITYSRRRLWNHKVTVEGVDSKVRFSIKDAPKGLSVGQDGTLAWNVPREIPFANKVSLVVTAHNGKSTEAQFSLIPSIGNLSDEASWTQGLPNMLALGKTQIYAADTSSRYLLLSDGSHITCVNGKTLQPLTHSQKGGYGSCRSRNEGFAIYKGSPHYLHPPVITRKWILQITGISRLRYRATPNQKDCLHRRKDPAIANKILSNKVLW